MCVVFWVPPFGWVGGGGGPRSDVHDVHRIVMYMHHAHTFINTRNDLACANKCRFGTAARAGADAQL